MQRMLGKRNKGQMMAESASDSIFFSDAMVHKPSAYPLFNVPGLFVGFTSKPSSDAGSASPTSPLDFKLFSNLGSSFIKSSRSSPGRPKCWDYGKVGLGLVDSLSDDSAASGMLLFGSQRKINIPRPNVHLNNLKSSKQLDDIPKSLPKNYVISSQTPRKLEKIRSCVADLCRSALSEKAKSDSEVFASDAKDCQSKTVGNFSGSLPMNFGSSHGFIGSLSASEIELSEDYTCIISHGPNPKTTHIFGDCILESHPSQSPFEKNKHGGVGVGSWAIKCSENSPSHSTDDLLSYCFSCNKKLEGKDIYMYRGEKAFCCCDCREQEILIEEEMQKAESDSSDSLASFLHDEIFMGGMIT